MTWKPYPTGGGGELRAGLRLGPGLNYGDIKVGTPYPTGGAGVCVTELSGSVQS